jgi:hypothetical protein
LPAFHLTFIFISSVIFYLSGQVRSGRKSSQIFYTFSNAILPCVREEVGEGEGGKSIGEGARSHIERKPRAERN